MVKEKLIYIKYNIKFIVIYLIVISLEKERETEIKFCIKMHIIKTFKKVKSIKFSDNAI